MILVYLRNQQLGRYEDFIARLNKQYGAVETRNPDYWGGRTERRASAIYTDFPKVLQAYREAGVDAYRISTDGLSLEEIAHIKGVDFEAKGGGWYAVDGETMRKSKARQTLEAL